METEWGLTQPKGSLYISMLCIVKNDGYSWPHARARNSIPIRCAHLIEKQIGDQRAAWLHRVAREIGHAGAREYLLVDVEMAGSLTCIGGTNPGLAVYIWHCLNESYGMPGLDILD